jgi:hypothetical protein
MTRVGSVPPAPAGALAQLRAIASRSSARLQALPDGVTLTGHVVVLALLYERLWLVPEHLGRLAPELYFRPFIAAEWLVQDGRLTVVAVWCAFAALGWRRLAWDRFEESPRLRTLILIVTFALAWMYGAYEYNAYVGQWHFVDRALLVALGALVAVHPTFVVPFMWHLRTIAEQFGRLVGAYSFTDKQIAFDVLLLFAVFLVWRLVARAPVRAFILLLSAMLASHFVFSAWTKEQLDWLASERIEFLFTSSHGNGWLAGWSPSTIGAAAGAFGAIGTPLKALVLAIELSPLLLLWNRRTYIGILGLLLVLHLGIFAASGLLFWKWMLVEAGLLLFVLRCSREWRAQFFRPVTTAIAVVLIIGAPLYFHPAQLGWLDTAITHTYDLEAVGRSGQRYAVPRHFMAPFDIVFGQNQFEYLYDGKAALTTYGATANIEVANAVNALVDRGEAIAPALARIEEQRGRNDYSEEQSVAFDDFMRRYFRTLNQRGTKGRLLGPLSPPAHIWNSTTGTTYDMQEPVTEILMRRRTNAWIPARRRFELLDDHIVRRVRIE